MLRHIRWIIGSGQAVVIPGVRIYPEYIKELLNVIKAQPINFQFENHFISIGLLMNFLQLHCLHLQLS